MTTREELEAEYMRRLAARDMAAWRRHHSGEAARETDAEKRNSSGFAWKWALADAPKRVRGTGFVMVNDAEQT